MHTRVATSSSSSQPPNDPTTNQPTQPPTNPPNQPVHQTEFTAAPAPNARSPDKHYPHHPPVDSVLDVRRRPVLIRKHLLHPRHLVARRQDERDHGRAIPASGFQSLDKPLDFPLLDVSFVLFFRRHRGQQRRPGGGREPATKSESTASSAGLRCLRSFSPFFIFSIY